MPARTWVLDAWVLGVLADGLKADASLPETSRVGAGVAFLHQMESAGHRVAVDSEGKIEREYRDRMAGCRWLQHWWARMQRVAGRVHRRPSNLERRHSEHLLHDLEFHYDDLPYVAVASQVSNTLLVSEDSDYTEAVKDYLKRELGLAVLTLNDALEQVRDP
jgi:hypothetical protein